MDGSNYKMKLRWWGMRKEFKKLWWGLVGVVLEVSWFRQNLNIMIMVQTKKLKLVAENIHTKKETDGLRVAESTAPCCFLPSLFCSSSEERHTNRSGSLLGQLF